MIKASFRGKIDELSDEWVYGSLVYSVSEKQYYIVEHKDNKLKYPVIEETIGQFTGLHDNLCRRIFEGDTVICGDSRFGEVKWDDSATFVIDFYENIGKQYEILYLGDYDYNIEVTGSIHDPE